MSDKVIIELELLTPLKYEKLIFVDDFTDILYEITKVYRSNNTLRNTASLGKPDYDDMAKAEKSILFNSYYIRQTLDEKSYTRDMVEFKGVSELEENNYCSLQYVITNSKDDRVMKYLQTFLPKMVSVKTPSYLIRTHIDDKTIETFKDIFEEL